MVCVLQMKMCCVVGLCVTDENVLCGLCVTNENVLCGLCVTDENVLCGLCVTDESGTNTWPDVLKFLFDCANSPDANLRESALLILRSVIQPFSPPPHRWSRRWLIYLSSTNLFTCRLSSFVDIN